VKLVKREVRERRGGRGEEEGKHRGVKGKKRGEKRGGLVFKMVMILIMPYN